MHPTPQTPPVQPSFTPVAQRVLAYLTDHPEPGSLHQLAAAVGASHAAVRIAIAILTAAGRLEVHPQQHRAGRPNTYRVVPEAGAR